jgi:hypothetical protein
VNGDCALNALESCNREPVRAGKLHFRKKPNKNTRRSNFMSFTAPGNVAELAHGTGFLTAHQAAAALAEIFR